MSFLEVLKFILFVWALFGLALLSLPVLISYPLPTLLSTPLIALIIAPIFLWWMELGE